MKVSANAVQRTLFFAARETSEAMKNDPALALRASATALQGMILNGVNDTIVTATNKAIIPVIRGALLGTDSVQCYRTFKREDANIFDKGMDALRVATDMAGVAGSLMMAFLPAQAKLGATLVGTAYAADLVSHAYRGITHANRRVQLWQTMVEGSDSPSNSPTSNPTDGPKPNPAPTTPTPSATPVQMGSSAPKVLAAV